MIPTTSGNGTDRLQSTEFSPEQKGRAGQNQFGKVSRLSVCAALRDGKTVLEDVSFTAPYKIMHPFEKPDGGIQIIPLCASAGIMNGDLQEFSYEVKEGANLEVLSQSFEKIHKMEAGPGQSDPCALRHIRASVARSGTLYCAPQPVIPFADSAFDSMAEIELADDSSALYWLEIISGGRTAHGERFRYRRFSSKISIRRAGTLIFRDNTRYEPTRMPMEAIGMYEGYTHMANLFLSRPQKESGAAKDLAEAIWALLEKETECEGGVTELWQGDLAVRIFGRRAQKLQELAEKIKQMHTQNLKS